MDMSLLFINIILEEIHYVNYDGGEIGERITIFDGNFDSLFIVLLRYDAIELNVIN